MKQFLTKVYQVSMALSLCVMVGNIAVVRAETQGAESADALDLASGSEPAVEELDAKERVRRRELQLLAEQLTDQAAQAYRKNKFEEAVDLYQKADSRLEKAGTSMQIRRDRQRIKEALFNLYADWGQSVGAEARNLASIEKFDEAIEKCNRAAELDPSRRAEMDIRIQRLRDLRKDSEFRVAIDPAQVDSDKPEREFNNNVLLEQGKVFLASNRLADARDLFEQVLLNDPYDVRAIRYLRKISEKLEEYSAAKRETTVADLMAEVSWKWNPPVNPLLSGPVAAMGGQAVRKVDDTASIREKLKSIIIPKLEFDQATIQTVINDLNDQSRKLDPDGQGINIFLQLEAGEAAAAPAAAPAAAAPADEFGGGFGDEFALPGEGAAAAPGAAAAAVSGRTITLNMNNIPLGEAIRLVCLGGNLKFRVESHAVIIADQSVALDELETRFYAIEAGVIDSGRTQEATDAGFGEEGGGGGGGSKGGGDSAGLGATAEDLKAFFMDLGVDFPDGARISYYQRTGKLVVHNTPENLRRVEKVLNEINKTPTQVTIEAKFVEVVQNDIESLGLEWTFNSGTIIGGGSSTFEVVKDSTVSKVGNALRQASDVFADVPQGSDALLQVNTILRSLRANTVIHALSQRDNTNVLSAPKVTTLSGKTAFINMGERRSFPTGWTEPEVERDSGDDGGQTFTPSTVEGWTEQLIGVQLEVTPTVAADGYSIDLQLSPEVVDFKGFDDSYNYNLILDGEEVLAKQLMPIFTERTVSTNVIIWDGETVVLGGMLGERITTWEDKVPVLGDVPLIGHLFRTKGEKSEKTNLLIFVTARLVNPAGLPLRANEIRGLPDFRR